MHALRLLPVQLMHVCEARVSAPQESPPLSAKAESVLRIARSIGGPFTRQDCGIPRDRRPDSVMGELQRAGFVERAPGLRDGFLLWRLTGSAVHESVPVVDFVVPCRDTREPDGDICPGEVRYGPGDVQAQCTVCRGWRGRYAPGDGPLVSDDEAARMIRAFDEVRRSAHERLIEHPFASQYGKETGARLLRVVNGPILVAAPAKPCPRIAHESGVVLACMLDHEPGYSATRHANPAHDATWDEGDDRIVAGGDR